MQTEVVKGADRVTLEAMLNRMQTDLSNRRSTPATGTENGKDSNACPICHGDEWILQKNEQGLEVAVECQCRKKSLAKRRVRFAEIPEAFSGMDLKTFRADVYKQPESKPVIITACKTIKEYLNNFPEYQERGMGLYIFSSTKGSGKTRMAASIANELMNNQNKQVKFASSTAILNEIKRTWGKDSQESESRVIDAITTSQVLVIDDFGAENPTDWVRERFNYIIDDRYANKRVTIITSNESVNTLPYDKRVTTRIRESTFQIQFPEESVREYIAQKNSAEMLKRISEL